MAEGLRYLHRPWWRHENFPAVRAHQEISSVGIETFLERRFWGMLALRGAKWTKIMYPNFQVTIVPLWIRDEIDNYYAAYFSQNLVTIEFVVAEIYRQFHAPVERSISSWFISLAPCCRHESEGVIAISKLLNNYRIQVFHVQVIQRQLCPKPSVCPQQLQDLRRIFKINLEKTVG